MSININPDKSDEKHRSKKPVTLSEAIEVLGKNPPPLFTEGQKKRGGGGLLIISPTFQMDMDPKIFGACGGLYDVYYTDNQYYAPQANILGFSDTENTINFLKGKSTQNSQIFRLRRHPRPPQSEIIINNSPPLLSNHPKS